MIETQLKKHLPLIESIPQKLHEAMHYAVLNGGKRMRPQLVYASGELLDIPAEKLHKPACAVEFIHCYSLVHDDLPSMDNDDLRRGKPTCHKAYDEATALLVGDALQCLAFEILTNDNEDHIAQAKMIAILTKAIGSQGMAGGQAIDLEAVGHKLTLEELTTMHRLKTGALIKASILMPTTFTTNFNDNQYKSLNLFSEHIGLAFQVKDDILDIEGDTETLGKQQGADQALNKPTFPQLIGMAKSKELLQNLHQNAKKSLQTFGPRANKLLSLAEFVITRNK